MCTDISNAGPRTGLEGERSGGTWREYARIVRELRPRHILVENSSSSAWTGNGRFSEPFPRSGTMRNGQCSACALGAPHTRERVFICGLHPLKSRLWWGSAEEAERALKGVTRPSGHRITLRLTDLVKLRDGGLINPQWVEWLMGFPVDWTAWDTSETL